MDKLLRIVCIAALMTAGACNQTPTESKVAAITDGKSGIALVPFKEEGASILFHYGLLECSLNTINRIERNELALYRDKKGAFTAIDQKGNRDESIDSCNLIGKQSPAKANEIYSLFNEIGNNAYLNIMGGTFDVEEANKSRALLQNFYLAMRGPYGTKPDRTAAMQALAADEEHRRDQLHNPEMLKKFFSEAGEKVYNPCHDEFAPNQTFDKEEYYTCLNGNYKPTGSYSKLRNVLASQWDRELSSVREQLAKNPAPADKCEQKESSGDEGAENYCLPLPSNSVIPLHTEALHTLFESIIASEEEEGFALQGGYYPTGYGPAGYRPALYGPGMYGPAGYANMTPQQYYYAQQAMQRRAYQIQRMNPYARRAMAASMYGNPQYGNYPQRVVLDPNRFNRVHEVLAAHAFVDALAGKQSSQAIVSNAEAGDLAFPVSGQNNIPGQQAIKNWSYSRKAPQAISGSLNSMNRQQAAANRQQMAAVIPNVQTGPSMAANTRTLSGSPFLRGAGQALNGTTHRVNLVHPTSSRQITAPCRCMGQACSGSGVKTLLCYNEQNKSYFGADSVYDQENGRFNVQRMCNHINQHSFSDCHLLQNARPRSI